MAPTIADLTRRFLASPPPAAVQGDVELYDAATAFRVEPREAWAGAVAVLKEFGIAGPLPKMPADWPARVRNQEPIRFLPMCLGAYPQMVSELSKLLDSGENPDSVPITPCAELIQAAVGKPDIEANERGVVLFFEGKVAEAIDVWNTMSAAPVKAFNLGIAALVNNEYESAKLQLDQAISQVSEESGWKSLAELYRAIAETKITV